MTLLLLVLLSAHAGLLKGRDAPPPDPAIVLQARTLAQDDRVEAIAILEDYLAQGADPAILPNVALEAGEQRRLAGDPNAAREHFERIGRTWPNTPSHEGARLGLALLAYETGKASGNSAATLELTADSAAPATMNADRYRLRALAASSEGADPALFEDMVFRAVEYARDDKAVLGRVNRTLAHLLPEDTPQIEGADDAADVAALDRARAALDADDYDLAIETAEAVLATFPDSEFVKDAEWIEKRARARDPYQPLKIGVLLPLTGTYAPPGKQVKQSLELSVGRGGGGVVLIFRDTEGDAEKAVEGFEDLVLREGCAAVIGPLLADTSFPVAIEAQAAGVPLITMTQSPGVTETGTWIYRGMVTIEQQVDSLLDEVMSEQGMTSFAILAPDSDYGRLARDEFLKQAMERGGTVHVVQLYDPAATDFRKDASALGAKDYEARKGELYRLRRQAEERGEDPSKVVLPPKMDYDAIFVPDSYGRVALVASALAYEEFPVGNFQPRRGMENIPLLGLSGWHNDELFTRGGLYVQSSVFVDAYTLRDPALQGFHLEFRADTGRSPNVLDAIAYDTGRLVSVASRSQPDSREAFRNTLSGAALSAPVSAGGRFDANREIVRDLYVLTIKRDAGIRLVHPIEEEVTPPG